MSGMLQHNDDYRDRAQRRQAEARRWAQVDHLGRLSKANRRRRDARVHHQDHHHTMWMRLRAVRMYLHLHGLHSPVHLPHH